MVNDIQEVITKLIPMLESYIEDWDLGEEVTAETRLNEDLCFSSVDLLHYLAIIDMNFQTKFPFGKLLQVNGALRTEITVGELAEFIYEHRHVRPQEPQPM